MLSQAPSRCVPILRMDANGRVGNGLLSLCFGAEQPAPENYNGGKLRELLDEHHMAAINTFFPAGDTFHIMGSLETIAELIMFAFRKPCWPGLKVAKFFFLQARDCN